ncbi:MAG: glutamate racemase [Planctomycetaceae bacterium]|nr:glutamate racemase [Planctomycetaceae bacterium]
MNIEIIHTPNPDARISVYDSGLGGLSILRELEQELPGERLYYFADNAHLPYGPRPLDEVRRFAIAIADQLLRLPSKAVVVACNTASAAALKPLRQTFPDIPFIGMEPAVKPAARDSRSGKVGVLATQATFQGELFESVMERFAHDVEVVRMPCPGLAEFIEMHPPDHPAMEPMVAKYVTPLVERGVDTLVLACTHYPLIKDVIAQVAGDGVAIVDPSPAIARRTRQVLEEGGLLASGGAGETTINVSGEAERFSRSASVHLGREVRAVSAPFLWVPVDGPAL